jgi:hypothetical protein
MSYTPGPWRVEFDHNEQANIHAENEEMWIALLPHQCVTSIEETQKLNAHLIAAAPDLLEACKRMLDLLNDDMDEEQCAAWDAMSAAIDKAEGMKP